MREYFGVKGIDTAWNKRSIADKVRKAVRAHLAEGGHGGYWTLQCLAKRVSEDARGACRS